MEFNLPCAILADVTSEYQGKSKRHLIVLTGAGKNFQVKKIQVPENYSAPEYVHVPYSELQNVELNEWTMNGKSGISYSIK